MICTCLDYVHTREMTSPNRGRAEGVRLVIPTLVRAGLTRRAAATLLNTACGPTFHKCDSAAYHVSGCCCGPCCSSHCQQQRPTRMPSSSAPLLRPRRRTWNPREASRAAQSIPPTAVCASSQRDTRSRAFRQACQPSFRWCRRRPRRASRCRLLVSVDVCLERGHHRSPDIR